MHNRRLFCALWPSEAERAALAAATQRLFPLSGRPVAPADLHITLAFIGAVAEPRVDRFLELRRSVSPVRISLDTLEHWPKSRVLVATASDVPDALRATVDALWQRLDRLGVQRETRAFRPHVTLARDVPRWRAGTAWPSVSWTAREIVVVESRPGEIPRYQPLDRRP
ncbi:MAG: RNA 2',3'-cyclic phosphodiesterase [Steroidobacteraceae bacterium]